MPRTAAGFLRLGTAAQFHGSPNGTFVLVRPLMPLLAVGTIEAGFRGGNTHAIGGGFIYLFIYLIH